MLLALIAAAATLVAGFLFAFHYFRRTKAVRRELGQSEVIGRHVTSIVIALAGVFLAALIIAPYFAGTLDG